MYREERPPPAVINVKVAFAISDAGDVETKAFIDL
jgi:hypothetical protein